MNGCCFFLRRGAVLSLLVSLALTTTPIWAQSGSRTRGGTAAPQAPFEVRFWNWLVRSNYRQWSPPAGKEAGKFYPGESPHGAFLRMYLNPTAAAHADTLPDGSIIVKENYDKSQRLVAVTVMYRSKGYNRAHGDWWWGKFTPDGKAATMAMPNSNRVMKLVGKPKGCIECHSGSDGDDYAFLNDKS